jgi:hypothetical protein
MRQSTRHPVTVALLLALLASLLTFASAGTAQADSTPPLAFPAVQVNPTSGATVASPSGDVTVACDPWGTQDLVTYGPTGAVVRQIPRSPQIDGVMNCIMEPTVDKNGDVYGIPFSDTGAKGPNLLAYDGNTLKWKYPVVCTSNNSSKHAMGADGNIYVTVRLSSGDVRLIGLTPEVEPGQTVPTKVLDIDVPNDCTMKVRPYKDGIVLHGQSSGGAQYYSYGGKFLGSTTGSHSSAQINADGWLFTYTFPNQGSYKSATVSAYNPAKGEVVWTKQVSTTGMNATGITSLSTLLGGGVTMLVKELMEGPVPGTPASPSTYHYVQVTLSANGVETRRVNLPNASGSDLYGDPQLIADGSGNTVLVRELNRATGFSSPATVPEIVIGMRDANGDIVSGVGGVISGTINAQNKSGYRVDNYTPEQLVASNGTLFVHAKCTGTCPNGTSSKLYPVTMTGLGMNYPRGDVLAANTPAQPAPKKMVVLGDSYTSGEGIEPFKDGTDTSTNKCHRSELAYANVINRNPNAAPYLAADTDFAACSGAETRHITTDSKDTENPQWMHLNGATEIVALTIGGNDIGFSDFGAACVLSYTNCRNGSSAYNTALGKINDELPAKLDAAYAKILEKAPNAQVYVLDYPQVAPVKEETDLNDPRCTYLYNSGYDATGTVPQNWADAQAAREIVTLLDNKIADRVNAMNSSRLHYVDVNALGSPFEGHTVCSEPGESYFNNLDQWVGHEAYALHPNKKGAEAYEKVLADALN